MFAGRKSTLRVPGNTPSNQNPTMNVGRGGKGGRGGGRGGRAGGGREGEGGWGGPEGGA